MELNVWRNFGGFTLIYEEKYNGGIGVERFLKFYSCIHVCLLRRGTISVFYVRGWGTYLR
jgi:hypothetical protein